MNEAALARRRRRRRVANDKRKRAARACDRCKARKSRCIESKPGQCQRCQQKNLSCRFEKEMSPGPGDSPARELSSDVSTSAAVESTTPAHGKADNLSINSHQPDRIMWPRFLSRLREAFSLDLQATPEANDMMAMQAHITGPRPLQPAELSRLRRAIGAFPPRHIADFLLTVCIKHGTDNFFYFDQGQFLSEIDEFYTNSQSPLRSDCGFVGLALAAFALGSQWTSLEKPAGPAPPPSITPTIDDLDPGNVFHSHLKPLVSDLIERPCVRSIQALFVMGVYLMPSSAVGSSYVYLGLALRTALAFDLHQSVDDALIDSREREVRIRLWWSLYSLERVTAIKLSRSRALDIGQVTLPLPSPHPALDRGKMFNNVPHQIAFTRLTMILDRITDLGTLQGPAGAEAVRCVEASLKEWKNSLSPDFKLSNIDPRDSTYRVVLHLYLNYYYAWIAMGKVSVVTVVRAHLHQNLGHGEPLLVDDTVRNLSSSCTNAARKIIRLFEMLTNTGNIARFSFTDFQGCSIATIVTLLAGILERDTGYDARVQFALECLRNMARGNMTARVGVRFVEALQSIANEAVVKVQKSGATGMPGLHNASSSTSMNDEYAQWIQWMSTTVDNSAQSDRSTSPMPKSPSPDLSLASSAPNPLQPPQNVSGNINVTQGDAIPFGHSSERTTAQNVAPSPMMGPPLRHIGDFGDHVDLIDPISSMIQGDDQNFFMGLTGLDVLDFSELPTV